MQVRRRWSRLVVSTSVIATAALSAVPAQAATLSASATVIAADRYVGDTDGATTTLRVKNTSTRRISALTVVTPTGWKASACGTALWTPVLVSTGCTFTSAAGSAGDLLPGRTAAFRVMTTTAPSAADLVSAWRVQVRAEGPSTAANATGSLAVRAYSFELARVVVQGPARAIGLACPAAATTAKAGSLTALVVCGKNHATAPVTINPSSVVRSSSFATGGTLTSGRVRAASLSVVMADVTGARVSSSPGSGRHVVLRVASADTRQRAPQTDFGGFTVSDLAPTATPVTAATDEDTPAALTLTGTDTDRDATTFRVVTPPAHGTLSGLATPGCTGTTTVVCRSAVTYTPATDANGPDSFSYEVKDPFGKTGTATVSLTVAAVNDAPTDLALDPSAVAENAPTTVVGDLTATDVDSGSFTYALVAGAGSTDNGLFSMSGSTLSTVGGLDLEAQPTYAVRVRATDPDGLTFEKALTVTATGVNEAPTGIALSPAAVAENQAAGTTVGTLSATDPDAGDTVTFSLPGGGDTTAFSLTGTTLATTSAFDKELQGTYSVPVRATDAAGLAFDKTLTVTVVDVNEAPSTPALNATSINENQAAGTAVGALSAVDPEGDALTFTLVPGALDNSAFQVSGTSLLSAASFDYETKNAYAVRAQVDDGNGHTVTEDFLITVLNLNDAPTALALTNASVPENSAIGTTVGALSRTDQDAGDTAAYSLPAGLGDNAQFAISGSNLTTAASFDAEVNSGYTVTVRITDGAGASTQRTFAITVTNVNEAPTAIALSDSTTPENAPIGSTVGTLSTTDQDVADTFTYTLPAGGDNAAFAISGGSLTTAVPFDREVKSSYAVTVRSTDAAGLLVDVPFTISITDINEAPTAVALSVSSVVENAVVGTTVGTASGSDPEGDALTFTLPSEVDNALFTLAGTSLKTAAVFDFETTSSYTVRVLASDGTGTKSQDFTITVVDANDAPTALALATTSVPENSTVGTVVGALSRTDQDVSDTATYSLPAGFGDNAQFAISGSSLTTNAVFDREAVSSYSIKVRVTDSGGATFDQAFTITVSNVNEAPTAVALSALSVAENAASGTTVGALSTTDPDVGGSFTYSLPVGGDNASFAISSGSLTTTAVFDRETKASYAVTVRSTDQDGLFFDQALTITVTDVNEAPSTPALAASSINENQASGATVGTLSSTDPEADALTFTLVPGVLDNSSFQVTGTSLQSAVVFDAETNSSYAVRVMVDDNHGNTVAQDFAITVLNVNDAPTALALATTSVPENSTVGTVVGALSRTDQDASDTATYSLPAGFGDNAQFAISGSSLTTNAVFDREAVSSYSIKVRVTDGGGATFDQAFTITVSNVNEAPTAVALSALSVAENAASGTTVGALSTTDPDVGGSFTYSLPVGGDNASFAISSGSLTTTAVFDRETKASYAVTVRSTDQDGLFFDQALTITVTDVNEAPSAVSLAGASVVENAVSGTTVGTVSGTDPEGDALTFSKPSAVDNALFTLTGTTLKTAAVFDFETTASYTVRLVASDGTSTTSQDFTITVVDANDAPTALALATTSVPENSTVGTVVGALSRTDQDVSDAATYSLPAGFGDNAQFAISGSSLTTDAVFDREAVSSYSIKVRVTDGGGATFDQAFTITVSDVNEAPTDLALSNASVVEHAAPGTTIGTLQGTDPDASDSFTYDFATGNGTDDADNGSFTLTAGVLKSSSDLSIGTYSIRAKVIDAGLLTFSRAFTITVFASNSTPSDLALSNTTVNENAAAGALVGTLSTTDSDAGDTFTYSLSGTDALRFQVSGSQLQVAGPLDYEQQASYSISITTNDGHGGTRTEAFTITANDLPEDPTDLALSASAVDENLASGASVGTLTTTDPDAGSTATYTLVDTATFPDNAAFTIASASLRTAAAFNFEAKASYSIKLRTTDGTARYFEKTFIITVNDLNDAPVATDESFSGTSSAIGNTALVLDGIGAGSPDPTGPQKTVTGNILGNDTDQDSGASLTAVAGTFATNDGGSVLIEADGDLTFFPSTGTSCTDTSDFFDYSVTDGTATDTGRVTIAITGCVWYVSNSAAGNSGTSSAPFDTLAQAQTASAAGQTIYVYDGDNTSTGYAAGIDLKADQRLLGEAADLQIGSTLLLTGVPANRPTITDNNADVVVLAAGDTVRGLDLDPQGVGGGISGTGIAGGTIDDVQVLDTATKGTQPGLELNTTTGTFTVSGVLISNGDGSSATSGDIGVQLVNAGTVSFSTTRITTSGAKALDATGTSLGTSSFGAITVTGSGSGGINLTATTGTTTFGDLSLTTTTGAPGAFVLNNAGTVTVPSGVTANVNATGGPAVDVTATSGPALSFDAVSSSSSSGSGVILNGLGTGTFSAAAGTLTGAAGTAFSLTSGSGTVSYAGAIADGTGNSVLVTGRTGGVVTLSGTITDGVDANGGVSVSSSSAGSTVFSGSAQTLLTTTGAGVTLSGNTGHTVSFTGGALSVTTTSGTAFAASGGGTVNVTGAGNTITTTSGGGLLIDSTTIGASDVTFQRISTSSATVGIRANTTGVTGRLVVTGSGGTCTAASPGTCTGGVIANGTGSDDSSATPAGTGIVLNSTLNPSFTRVYVHDFNNYAIRGTLVAGFTLATSVVSGTNGNNAASPFDEGAVVFDNLTGSAAVTDTFVGNGVEDSFRVRNTAGSLNRITFTNATLGSTSTSNDALGLFASGAAGALNATVTGSTFTGAAGDLLQYDNSGGSTGDLVITGSTFSNNHPSIATGGGGLSLYSNGLLANLTSMSITGSTFRDAVGAAVLAVKGAGGGTLTGTFANNTIGVSGTPNLGSREGSGLKLQSVGQGTLTWAVTNNQVYGYNNFGVEVLAGGGSTAQSGAVNTTIMGNTIAQPGTTASTATIPKQGVHLNIGTVPGDTFAACANIKSNTISASGADATPATGVNVDVRLRQRQATSIRLPGYGGTSNDNTAVQSFVIANNDAGTTVLAANTVGGPAPAGGGFTGAGTSCP